MNEYGGGPDNFEDMAADHMKNYIKLTKSTTTDEAERNNLYLELRNYLLEKSNMCTDYLNEIFELNTGMKINR